MKPLKSKKRTQRNRDLSVADHLKELKCRVLVSAITYVVFIVMIYAFKGIITDFVLQQGRDAGFSFIYSAPQDLFIQQIKLVLTVAALGTSPFVVWEVVAFISPAFDIKVRKYVVVVLLFYCMLVCGMLFSYSVLIPFAMQYFASVKMTAVTAVVTIKEYMSFITTMIILIGFVFELPLVVGILSKLHIVNAAMLRAARKVIVVISFIVAAIITPPDVVSQFMVAIPILILYEISIGVSMVFNREKSASEPNE